MCDNLVKVSELNCTIFFVIIITHFFFPLVWVPGAEVDIC